MNFRSRLTRAVDAFRADPKGPAARLREMPTAEQMRSIRGNESYSSSRKGKKPFQRQAYHNRRWMPPDIESALTQCDRSGILFDAMTLSAYAQANPVIWGVTQGRTQIPQRRVGIQYSDEAAAWLEGTPQKPGMRTRIANPDELCANTADEFFGGQCVGLLVWNAKAGHPEFEALDPAGLWYRHSEKRWQYRGWSQVFDICEDEMIRNECGTMVPNPWVLGTLSKNAPWYRGIWHKIDYDAMAEQLARDLRDVWSHNFSMPLVMAKSPQGASNEQKARFTENVLGPFLRIIGVTPGFEVEFKQATAEGSDVYQQSEAKLEKSISILTWGTVGLIAGGSGFSNSDMFDQMKDDIIGADANRIARRENAQIWRKVLKWAQSRGYISQAATNACIEYQTESPAVIERKAKAAKALIETGYSPEEAHRRVGLEKSSMPETPTSATPTAPEPREDVPEEPGYSEKLAADMTKRNRDACPHGETRSCSSCRVVRRYELQEEGDPYRAVWHSYARRAA